MRNVLNRDMYLIGNELQDVLQLGKSYNYSKGIFLVKLWNIK